MLRWSMEADNENTLGKSDNLENNDYYFSL